MAPNSKGPSTVWAPAAIYVIYGFIFLSPIATHYQIVAAEWQLWMLAAPIGCLAFGRGIFLAVFGSRSNVFYVLFIIYICLSAFGSALDDPVSTAQRLPLFLATFGMFLGLLHTKVLIEETSRRLVIFVAAYGIYQAIARTVGLPFDGAEIFRGRESGFLGFQVSSFFAEPAHFAAFLTAMLYFSLFVRERVDYFTAALVFVCLLLARSVGGAVGGVVICGLFALSTLIIEPLRGKRMGRRWAVTVISFLLLSVVASIAALSTGLDAEVATRLDVEVAGNAAQLFADPRSGIIASSGGARVVTEINYAMLVLGEAPLFGFGVAYDAEQLNRTMSLNGIAEIAVRWGLVGLALLATALVLEKRRYPPKSLLGFVAFFAVYCFQDGAISKPQFWLPIAIILVGERLRCERERQRVAEIGGFR